MSTASDVSVAMATASASHCANVTCQNSSNITVDQSRDDVMRRTTPTCN